MSYVVKVQQRRDRTGEALALKPRQTQVRRLAGHGASPEMGATVLAEAFVMTVVGGMGSLAGAVVAGLLVGVVVSMTALFAPEMAKVSMYALMALVLLVRPQGLFGRPSALG